MVRGTTLGRRSDPDQRLDHFVGERVRGFDLAIELGATVRARDPAVVVAGVAEPGHAHEPGDPQRLGALDHRRRGRFVEPDDDLERLVGGPDRFELPAESGDAVLGVVERVGVADPTVGEGPRDATPGWECPPTQIGTVALGEGSICSGPKS